MWRKIIGNKLLVTKKMWKSLLRKDLNLRKFKTSAFLVKHMTPLTLFLLTWMSIDCRKFARKLYFASSIRKHFTKHFSLFYFRKIPNSYFMFMTWIDDAKNKLQKFIFLLAVWNPMDNLMQSSDKVCEWYFCFSNSTLFQQKKTPFLFSFVEKLGKHI